MIWIGLTLVITVCIVLLILRGMKGPAHTLETLQRPIKDLLKRGYNGAFLIIDISPSKCFLQLRKYVHAPGDYGIELCFPNATWSVQFFQRLRVLCDTVGIAYSIGKEDDTGPLEFLYIDFGKDSSKAHQCIKQILLEVFEVDEHVKLFVRLENATIEDKLIDR